MVPTNGPGGGPPDSRSESTDRRLDRRRASAAPSLPSRWLAPGSGGEIGAFEKRIGAGLLFLDREQTSFQSMLVGKKTMLQPVLARNETTLQSLLADENEAGEGDTGGDGGDELGGQAFHERILAEPPPPGVEPDADRCRLDSIAVSAPVRSRVARSPTARRRRDRDGCGRRLGYGRRADDATCPAGHRAAPCREEAKPSWLGTRHPSEPALARLERRAVRRGRNHETRHAFEMHARSPCGCGPTRRRRASRGRRVRCACAARAFRERPGPRTRATARSGDRRHDRRRRARVPRRRRTLLSRHSHRGRRRRAAQSGHRTARARIPPRLAGRHRSASQRARRARMGDVVPADAGARQDGDVLRLRPDLLGCVSANPGRNRVPPRPRSGSRRAGGTQLQRPHGDGVRAPPRRRGIRRIHRHGDGRDRRRPAHACAVPARGDVGSGARPLRRRGLSVGAETGAGPDLRACAQPGIGAPPSASSPGPTTSFATWTKHSSTRWRNGSRPCSTNDERVGPHHPTGTRRGGDPRISSLERAVRPAAATTDPCDRARLGIPVPASAGTGTGLVGR